jgi:hypothetical protein
LAHLAVQVVAHEGDGLGLWDGAYLLDKAVSVLSLLLRVIKQEGVWFEIVDGVLLQADGRLLLHVHNTLGLQVFEVHVGVSKLFLASLKGLFQVLHVFAAFVNLFKLLFACQLLFH